MTPPLLKRTSSLDSLLSTRGRAPRELWRARGAITEGRGAYLRISSAAALTEARSVR